MSQDEAVFVFDLFVCPAQPLCDLKSNLFLETSPVMGIPKQYFEKSYKKWNKTEIRVIFDAVLTGDSIEFIGTSRFRSL